MNRIDAKKSPANLAKLRVLCANDVYKPSQFSLLKTLQQRYTLGDGGVTKCVFPGDFLGGSLFAQVHRGQSMLEVCDMIGFDYVTLGNHEFDYGADRTRDLMRMSTNIRHWLGSNIRDAEKGDVFAGVTDVHFFDVPILCNSDDADLLGKPWLPSSLKKSVACQENEEWSEVHEQSLTSSYVRVGVFGVCTQDTPNLSFPTNKVKFEDSVETSRRCVKRLKQELFCDVVIALTHVSLDIDKRIADIGGVDVIIGGHDHDPFYLQHDNVIIIKCGENLKHLGILDLKIERDVTGTGEGRSVSIRHSFQLLPTAGVPSDSSIDDVIVKWQRLADSKNSGDDSKIKDSKPLVRIRGSMSTRAIDCRARECTFPCLLADAITWSYQSKENDKVQTPPLLVRDCPFHADFGIQNGGFIRGDMVYIDGSVITAGTIRQELPFEQCPVLVQMTGREVCEALSQMLPPLPPPILSPAASAAFVSVTGDDRKNTSVSSGASSSLKISSLRGSFPHLSKELSAGYNNLCVTEEDQTPDTQCPASATDNLGGDVDNSVSSLFENLHSVCVHGKPIELDKKYNVAVSAFYALGTGDGITGFHNKTILAQHNILARDVMIAYLESLMEESHSCHDSRDAELTCSSSYINSSSRIAEGTRETEASEVSISVQQQQQVDIPTISGSAPGRLINFSKRVVF